MALYGLSVFLETPEPQRKGRKRYIAASFVITGLRALGGSLDMANYFQVLFKSTSVADWNELFLVNFSGDWKYILSNTVLGLVPMIGDALLVSGVSSLIPVIWADSWSTCHRSIAVILFVWSIGG
jgi:hypothetical protein